MGYSPEGLTDLLEGAGFDVTEIQLWLRRWGVLAHEAYAHVEPIVPLRLATLPITDAAAVLDRRRPAGRGQHGLRPRGQSPDAHVSNRPLGAPRRRRPAPGRPRRRA